MFQALSRRRLETIERGGHWPQGWVHLTFAREKDGGRRGNPDQSAESDDISTTTARSKKKRGDTPEVGQALRTVYQRTVEEDIPPDLLDLLGKLG